MTPLVSVIVPIYNVEPYLKNCLYSIINQTYRNMEIILIDDESPDNSGKICEDFAKEDYRIKVIHKKNAGLGLARNSGLEVATGDYVIFVDSDDWIDLKMVETMIIAATENECDFVVCGFNRKSSENSSGQKIQYTQELKIVENENILAEVLYPILGTESKNANDIEREMCVWTNMYKMSVIKDNNILFVTEREYLSEDLFFNINFILNTKKAALLPDCLYNYRLNLTSLTNRYRPERFMLLTNLYDKECEILAEYGILDKVKIRVNRTFIMKTRNAVRILVNSKNITQKEKKNILKDILYSETLIKVIEEYPIGDYRLSLRIPAFLIKAKSVKGLILEQKLRVWMKKVMR